MRTGSFHLVLIPMLSPNAYTRGHAAKSKKHAARVCKYVLRKSGKTCTSIIACICLPVRENMVCHLNRSHTLCALGTRLLPVVRFIWNWQNTREKSLLPTSLHSTAK